MAGFDRLMGAFLALVLTGTALAAPAPQPVLQLGHNTLPLTAAWTGPGQRYLVTAAANDIITWDPVPGHVINYQPITPPAANAQLQPLRFAAGGGQLQVKIMTEDEGETSETCAVYNVDPLGSEATVQQQIAETACDARTLVAAAARNRDGRSWAIAGPDVIISPGAGGGATVVLKSARNDIFSHGVVSPDAGLLAQLASRGSGKSASTLVVARSLRTGAVFPERLFNGSYAEIRWIDEARFVLIPEIADSRSASFCTKNPALPVTIVVDAASGKVLDELPTLRETTLLGTSGTLVGIGPDCATPATMLADHVYRRVPGGSWQPLAFTPEGSRITERLSAQPDGAGIALMTALPVKDSVPRHLRVEMIKLAPDGSIVRHFKSAYMFDRGDETGRSLWGFGIGRDSATLAAAFDERIFCFDMMTAALACRIDDVPDAFQAPTFFSHDREALLIGSPSLSQIYMRTFKTGRVEARPADNLQSGGVLPGRNLIWTLSGNGTTRFYDRKRAERILTSFRLGDGGYFNLDASGRYDTNQGADSGTIRWRLSDRPWESLPPQMFMRDRYEPDLLPRRIDCTSASDCETVFPPLKALRLDNRGLPVVRIVRAVPGPRPGTARIDVEATSRGAEAASGLKDLRLLRDGRLVAQWPPPGETDDTPPLLPAGRDGFVQRSFTVALPVTRGDTPVAFSAYGFNADGRKGETSDRSRLVPPRLEQHPRAFILSIGIDRYAVPGKNLSFAAADARALTNALAKIDGYTVHAMTLVADGRNSHATRALIRAAFGLLAGTSGGWARQLEKAGVAVGGFEAATPDDIVVITWSGHGIVDPRGVFALVPSDVRLAGGGDLDPASLVGAGTLADWLRPLDAGEIALIIDACHSAASIVAGGFKPGPMGDKGLGQLAFDKGIRVLAATQADDVALESRQARLGLLTAALIRDGLGGNAPGTSDGWIRLDALLRDAAISLPRQMLAERARIDAYNAAAWPPLLVSTSPQPPARVQLPAVFDFTGASSPAWLQASAQ